jgi:hypothetical protein
MTAATRRIDARYRRHHRLATISDACNRGDRAIICDAGLAIICVCLRTASMWHDVATSAIIRRVPGWMCSTDATEAPLWLGFRNLSLQRSCEQSQVEETCSWAISVVIFCCHPTDRLQVHGSGHPHFTLNKADIRKSRQRSN